MEKTFNFKIIDIVSGVSKSNKQYYKIITYCNFGFIVNFFVTPDNMNKLRKLQEDKTFDINNYIKIFYDNTKQNFAYIINFN